MATATSTTTITTREIAKRADIDAFRARLTGVAITPGHDDYDEARRVADITRDARPGLIVRVVTAADVAESVRFAQDAGMRIAVRSGGHSVAGFSAASDTLTIDVTRMKGITIDPERRTARVQSGVTSGDLAGPAAAHGLALTTGDASSVGLGGLVTGGGIGWMVRKYGLTIDNLLSAEVVTADGQIVRASADEHAELFWAIRGGGGNFGVITEFEFRLAPVAQVLGGAIFLPATRDVIRGYLEWAAAAPEDMTTIAQLMRVPPAPFVPAERVGEMTLLVMPCWTGDIEEGQRELAKLRALAEPIAEMVAPFPYPVMYQFTEEATKPHGADIRSMFTNAISDSHIDAMIDAIGRGTATVNMVQIRGLGGAMARVEAGATAFAHRDKQYMVSVLALWADAAEDAAPHRAWTRGLWEQIRGAAEGVYVNFLAEEPERLLEAYPQATYDRLARVKRAWDRDNVFALNHNIRPR